MPFRSRADWLTWLRAHADSSPGIWLELAKKASGTPTVSYEEVREVALSFGWVDGLVNGLDEARYLLRVTPRRPKSKWSKINRAIAERLIESGAMQPRGRAEVEAAKADGRWAAAYDPPSTIQPHVALVRALEAAPRAKAAFDALPRSKRFVLITGVNDAKREETRARKIAAILEMLERDAARGSVIA